MLNDATSRHIRNSAELLLRAPVKQGFPEIEDTLSYASRLRTLLGTLYKARRASAERNLRYGTGPIEQLQTLLDSQWTVTQDDRHLLVTVSFDRSWEEYFEILVRQAGPSLDLIFSHCEGFEDHSCVGPDGRLRYQAFADWVRRHQFETDFYYPTAPDMTVDDLAYLRRIAAQAEPSIAGSAPVHIGTPAQEARHFQVAAARREIADGVADVRPDMGFDAESLVDDARQGRARRALEVLYELRKVFPEPVGAGPTTLYEIAVQNLIPEISELEPYEGEGVNPEVEGWIQHVRKVRLEAQQERGHATLPRAALGEIQGNILTPYRRMSHGCTVLMRCDSAEAGRKFLAAFESRVTSQAQAAGDGPHTNLAITFSGLQRLELHDDVLAQFPKEFRQGMAERNGALGDLGASHPYYWELPHANWPGAGASALRQTQQTVPLSAVDFVVTLQQRLEGNEHGWADHPLRTEVESLEDFSGVHILHVQLLQREPNPEPSATSSPEDAERLREQVREHFGFVDGLSQPVPDATLGEVDLRDASLARDRVPLGEALLGEVDARGEVRWCADPQRNRGDSLEFFEHGSFLVLRKLEQDVAGFQRWARDNAEDGQQGTEVESHIVGRYHDGERVLDGAPGNDFDYSDDRDGTRCPLHAHVRRANPRHSIEGLGPVPRIFRRGFSYGPRHGAGAGADAEARGLMFMAYNASIAGQYEVIQRWLNGGNSTGLRSTQNDLLTGTLLREGGPYWLHGETKWRHLKSPHEAFTTLRWGLYAFVPTRRALRWIGTQKTPDMQAMRGPGLVAAGEALIAGLVQLERERGSEIAADGWKAVIEDPKKRPSSVALWSAVHARGGRLQTPYGLLVAGREGAADVLSGTGTTFSVREYWHRLMDTVGEHYIALDPEAATLPSTEHTELAKHARYEQRLQTVGYADTAAGANAYIMKHFDFAASFGIAESARATATALLDGAVRRGEAAREAAEQRATDEGRAYRDPRADDKPAGQIRLTDFATVAVAHLSRAWFGVPDVPHAPDGGDDESADLARGIEPVVRASQYAFQPWPGPGITRYARQLSESPVQPGSGTDFRAHLEGELGFDAEQVRSVLVGSTVGFAAPAIASITTVVMGWIKGDALAGLAEGWSRAGDAPRRWLWLVEHAVRALSLTPVPSLLYRVAMPGAQVLGEAVEAGMRTIVGLGAAALDGEPDGALDWLFGGPREINPHGCPARYAAIASVVGTVSAILERENLLHEGGLLLRFGDRRADAPGIEPPANTAL